MYSRENPSPRYVELGMLYRLMHEEGERFLGKSSEETFSGLSLPPQAGRIRRLVEATRAETLLDYGSGKGRQYEGAIDVPGVGRFDSIVDYWDVSLQCYDPSYEPFSILPSGKFDGVISTDVLEHCPEEDLPWIVDEIFGYAERFVFANVACYPALKRLPNGENAHCTIRPPDWWQALLQEIARRHPNLLWEFWIQYDAQTPVGLRRTESRLTNMPG